MTEAATCDKCGVDVLDNTEFCYNCGAKLEQIRDAGSISGDPMPRTAETQAALDDLEKQFKIEGPKSKAEIAKGSVAKRKPRITSRKSNEYVWEPTEPSAGLIPLVIAFLFFVVTAVVVVFTVYWK